MTLSKSSHFVAAALLSVVAASSMAATKMIHVSPFTELSLKNGLIASVSCGKTDSVLLASKNGDFKNVTVNVENNELKIKYNHPVLASHEKMVVKITASHVLVGLYAGNGVKLGVNACAVNPNQLTIKLANGVKASVRGKTKSLTVSQARGVTLDAEDLEVDSAKVDAKMGSTVRLCEAKKVSGSLSLGSTVYVEDDADTSGLKTMMGASKHDC